MSMVMSNKTIIRACKTSPGLRLSCRPSCRHNQDPWRRLCYRPRIQKRQRRQHERNQHQDLIRQEEICHTLCNWHSHCIYVCIYYVTNLVLIYHFPSCNWKHSSDVYREDCFSRRLQRRHTQKGWQTREWWWCCSCLIDPESKDCICMIEFILLRLKCSLFVHVNWILWACAGWNQSQRCKIACQSNPTEMQDCYLELSYVGCASTLFLSLSFVCESKGVWLNLRPVQSNPTIWEYLKCKQSHNERTRMSNHLRVLIQYLMSYKRYSPFIASFLQK